MNDRNDSRLKNLIGLSVTAVLLMLLMSGYTWTQLADGVEGALAGLFALPFVLGGVVVLVVGFGRIESRKANMVQSRKALTAITITLLLFFLIIHTISLLNLLDRADGLSSYWPILAGVVLIVMGNYLGKLRSNGMVGFRTPWTLESETAWNKTHRLGGKLLFLLGIIMMTGSLVTTGEFWVTFLIIGSIVWVSILFIYSYTIWKNDQAKL